MNQFFEAFANKLDVYIIGLVILSGFFQKNYLQGIFNWTKNSSYNSLLKTLFVSFVVSAIYILLIKNPEKGDNWAKYFLSYFTATSLYDIIISPFTEWIKRKIGAVTTVPKD